jgi:hypothetical protein
MKNQNLTSVLTLLQNGFITIENTETIINKINGVNPTVQNQQTPKKSSSKNSDFGKLRNSVLKGKLQSSKTVDFDPEKHILIKDLKYKSLYEMDRIGIKKWEKYFSKYNVYLRKGINTKHISPKVMFDKGLLDVFSIKRITWD